MRNRDVRFGHNNGRRCTKLRCCSGAANTSNSLERLSHKGLRTSADGTHLSSHTQCAAATPGPHDHLALPFFNTKFTSLVGKTNTVRASKLTKRCYSKQVNTKSHFGMEVCPHKRRRIPGSSQRWNCEVSCHTRQWTRSLPATRPQEITGGGFMGDPCRLCAAQPSAISSKENGLRKRTPPPKKSQFSASFCFPRRRSRRGIYMHLGVVGRHLNALGWASGSKAPPRSARLRRFGARLTTPLPSRTTSAYGVGKVLHCLHNGVGGLGQSETNT